MKKRMKKPLVGALGVLLVCSLVLGLAGAALATVYSWTPQTIPSTDYKLFGATAPDATHAWAVGTNNASPASAGKSLFWNGTSWADGGNPGTSTYWNDVEALNATNVWAVGEDNEVATNNGTTWSHDATKGGTVQGTTNQDYYSIDVLAGNSIFVVGKDTKGTSTGADDTNIVRYWDGSIWANQNIQDTTPADILVMLNGVVGFGANDAFACGYTSAGYGQIYRRTGAGWGTTYVYQTPTTDRLYGIYGAANNDVWAIGRKGTIFHFDGTSWAPHAQSGVVTTQDLNGLWGLDASHIWACGNNGTILFFNGTTWAVQSSPLQTATTKLNAVCPLNAINCWTTGTSTILYRTDMMVNGCNPASGIQGKTLDVTVTGQGTHFVNGTSVANFGAGITVNSTTVTDGNNCTANITIAGDAAVGPRDVNVVTGAENPAAGVGVFNVIYNPNAPRITGIKPASGPPGTEVTLTGENFGASEGLSQLSLGDMNPAVTSWSDTQIKFLVPDNAVSGAVTLVTPGGTSNSVDFTVFFDTFYFAEGCCRPNFETFFCIQNTNATAAKVKITYMLTDGKTKEANVEVPKQSRATVSAKQTLGEGDDAAHDFSTLVQTTDNKGIIVERPMYFNYQGNWSGGHDVFGVTDPATNYYFAEGSVQPDFDTYYCIMNPGNGDAEVKITYLKTDGQTVEKEIVIPKQSRSTVSAKADLGWFGSGGKGGQIDFSARIESTNQTGIVAERPMYFNYKGVWTGGHDVVGALDTAPEYYFAEGSCRTGIDPYFTIMNPGNEDSLVVITYMFGDGTTKDEQVTVGAHSRATVVIKDKLGSGDDVKYDFSAKVKTAQGPEVVVERPMYFDYKAKWTGGHIVVGATAPAMTYKFAEGTCRPNFEPYFCVQNPQNAAAKVKITYIMGDGTSKVQEVAVSATSRVTVMPKDLLGEGEDAAHDFSAVVEATTGGPIIVERPMYFNFQGKWSGGHDVIGFDR